MGEVTFNLPVTASASAALARAAQIPANPVVAAILGSQKQTDFTSNQPEVAKLTISHVNYMPKARMNLLSWSELKKTRGIRLALEENTDGGLSVMKVTPGGAEEIMRFEEENGLYWLVREKSNGTKQNSGLESG